MRVLFPLLLTGMSFAQQPQAPGAAKPKRPMPPPKNLQVLKVPPSEIMGIMQHYSASLGVQCTFCHVKGDFASDDNQHKAIARTMIAMTQEINAKLADPSVTATATSGIAGASDAKVAVSCFTCHRGEEHPEVTPPKPPPPPPAPPKP